MPEEWQQRIAAIDAITVHRPGGHDLVRRLYAESHALLFPSHMDTFGYVVLEANAYGLPVLAPDHLAMTQLVGDDETGLLFPPENPLYGNSGLSRFNHLLPPPRRYLDALQRPSETYVDAIAARLAKLAEDRDLLARLAGAALERVRTGPFSIEHRREVLGRLYSDAAA